MPERIEPGIVNRPLVIFDGRCSFCRRWVERAKSITADALDYEEYQTAAARFPTIDPSAFGRAVHLIEPDGHVCRGARAVFGALHLGGRYRWLLAFYNNVPGFAGVSEALYRLVASHREISDHVDILLIGPGQTQPSYLLTRQIFLRLLGIIYFCAFVSLGSQIDGLIGSHGILPAGEFLDGIQSAVGHSAYWRLPTLCWLNGSDAFLHFLWIGGAAAAIAIVAGLAQLPALIVCLAFYLSLSLVGQDFLSFQWDCLLVETGFLAIFFAPARIWSWNLQRQREPSRAIIWLLRWLVFRLVFMSGVVKLMSGDESWHGWTAMRFHYMTQPLPTWTSWYFYQLPNWFQTLSCGVVFFCELIVPFLFFAPRRIRLLGFWISIAFQVLILATGNYGIFNLLAIALCCMLPDDSFWRWLLRLDAGAKIIGPPIRWRRWINVPLSIVILALTIPICVEALGVSTPMPAPVAQLSSYAQQLRLTNGYGLFAVMTTQRHELVIQGSDDGREWKTYEFKWKPGDLGQRPEFTTPHMPRLDWQMWFAALGDANENPWIVFFMQRLLEGSKPVLDLMDTNPFPDHPPRYLRAMAYDYQMTNFAEKRATGDWWKRQELGIYFGPIEAAAKD